jgi:hypothetical protein
LRTRTEPITSNQADIDIALSRPLKGCHRRAIHCRTERCRGALGRHPQVSRPCAIHADGVLSHHVLVGVAHVHRAGCLLDDGRDLVNECVQDVWIRSGDFDLDGL